MNQVTITSKLGHYEADLTSTLDGVEVTLWGCYQDTGGMRVLLSKDMVDAPLHHVANLVHQSIYHLVPDFVESDTGLARSH